MRRYFPWLPSWLDVNVVVPVAATVVVIIVGIVVICVALSRRTRGPEQTRLRGISSADEKYYEGQCIQFYSLLLIKYSTIFTTIQQVNFHCIYMKTIEYADAKKLLILIQCGDSLADFEYLLFSAAHMIFVTLELLFQFIVLHKNQFQTFINRDKL